MGNTPPLATLRAQLAHAEKQRTRRYWEWRDACMQVKRLAKAVKAAEAQATPPEAPCSS